VVVEREPPVRRIDLRGLACAIEGDAVVGHLVERHRPAEAEIDPHDCSAVLVKLTSGSRGILLVKVSLDILSIDRQHVLRSPI